MKRPILIALVAATFVASVPAGAGPTQGGFASGNVEFVAHVPFEVGTATGARVIGNYMYVTSWKNFSIYDVSDPLAPQLVSTRPFGFKFENEDVATNGEILLFSEQLPLNTLHVWDVEDKSNPTQVASLIGGGGHTSECVLDCSYSYSNEGVIVDLRDPTTPKVVGNWMKGTPVDAAHDLNEVAPGMVLASSHPIVLLDARKDPAKPKMIAVGNETGFTGAHSNRWPNKGTDDLALFSSESIGTGRCNGDNGAFMTWDASDWKRTHRFALLDTFQLRNGTYDDGSPAANALGCSAHWFEEHPTFDNGGLVALGAYEHGTRFLDVAPSGKIEEIGYFLPYAGETSAAYWLTKDLLYAVDYARGIDVLRFTDHP